MDIRAVTTLASGRSAGLPGGFQAWEGGRLVGSLTLFAPLGHTAEVSAFVPTEHRRRGNFSALPAAEGLSIYSVAVEPARQGQGLGRRLMAGLLAILPRDRALVVEVDSRNRPARALYAAFGFRETRRQDYFVRGL